MTLYVLLFWASACAIAYSLVIYPLIQSAFGRSALESFDREQPQPLPGVTLIIPAYNEEVWIERKIENSLALDYPADRLEIVVASDGSSDRTVELAKRYEERGVRVLAFPENRGKASVVNDAVARASNDVICLCDANVMFHRDALRWLVMPLVDERVGAVSGDVRLASHESNFGLGETAYYAIERRVQLGQSRIGSMIGVDGGMYVLRRCLFRSLPPDTILDDFVLTMFVIQQGYRVRYEPRAVALENGTPKARDEFRRRIRVAAGAAQSIRRGHRPRLDRPVEWWQYVSHKLLRWLGPLWFIILLGSNIAIWPGSWLYQATLVGQGGVYLLAALGAVSVRFRQTRLGGIPFYFAMSQVAMGIGLVRGFCLPQRGTWKRTERQAPADDYCDASQIVGI